MFGIIWQVIVKQFEWEGTFGGAFQEIAGGVCQAVVECGGWFDFGHGGRGGMSEPETNYTMAQRFQLIKHKCKRMSQQQK